MQEHLHRLAEMRDELIEALGRTAPGQWEYDWLHARLAGVLADAQTIIDNAPAPAAVPMMIPIEGYSAADIDDFATTLFEESPAWPL